MPDLAGRRPPVSPPWINLVPRTSSPLINPLTDSSVNLVVLYLNSLVLGWAPAVGRVLTGLGPGPRSGGNSETGNGDERLLQIPLPDASSLSAKAEETRSQPRNRRQPTGRQTKRLHQITLNRVRNGGGTSQLLPNGDGGLHPPSQLSTSRINSAGTR